MRPQLSLPPLLPHLRKITRKLLRHLRKITRNPLLPHLRNITRNSQFLPPGVLASGLLVLEPCHRYLTQRYFFLYLVLYLPIICN